MAEMVLTLWLFPPGFAIVEFLFWSVKGLLNPPARTVTLAEYAGRQGHFISQEAVDFVAVACLCRTADRGSVGGYLAPVARGVLEGNRFVADDQLLGRVSAINGLGAGSYGGEVIFQRVIR